MQTWQKNRLKTVKNISIYFTNFFIKKTIRNLIETDKKILDKILSNSREIPKYTFRKAISPQPE